MRTIGDLKDSLKAISIAKGIPEFPDIVYEEEVKSAIAEINRCRRFRPHDNVLYDEQYEDKIIPLCIASLAKIGAEGQSSHSENGVSRNYGNDGQYPTAILRSIKPLIK